MQFEEIPINVLKSLPKNARKHSKRNIDVIKKSLKECGQQKPIVVDANNVVLAGNGTLESAKQLGWDKIWIARTSLDQKRADLFAILDNRTAELAEWDLGELKDALEELDKQGWDLEEIGWDAKDLKSVIPEEVAEGLIGDDEIPEVTETRAKPGDLWLLGDHRLLCGDSTDVLLVERLLNGSHPDLMVTDPPYGVEYDPNWRNEAAKKGLISYGAKAVGIVQNDDRADWSATYALFNADVAYVWHAGKFAKEVQQSLEDADFIIISQIIWAKPSFAISRGDYHWQHEPCWYAHKKGKTHNWQGSRSEATLWTIDKGCKEKTGHGTEKPVECMERPIRNNSSRGQLVVDPFLGSGTTLIACEKTGRKCYGMELNPKYCDIIIGRWEKFTGQKATLKTDEGEHG